MVKIKYIDTSTILQFDSTQIGCTYFLNRFNDYTQGQNKLNVYCEYMLLKNLLNSVNVNLDQQTIIKDKNGKPIFKNLNVFFNISHSKNLVAVAISNKPIGIDVQAISSSNLKTNLNIAQRFFNQQTLSAIQKSKSPNIQFTKSWAKYESILKLNGSRKAMQNNKHKIHSKLKKLKDSNSTLYYLCLSSQNHFHLTIKKVNANI